MSPRRNADAPDPVPTSSVESSLNYRLVHSNHPVVALLKRLRRAVLDFSVPAPRVLTLPLLYLVLGVRRVYHFMARVFVCEPLFKAYCASYGEGVHTGVFLHWVRGKGRIELGDHVLVDGKCSFAFGARYTEMPLLRVGSHTGIGHNCTFVVGKAITIGEHCRIANDVVMFDSSGHPSEPVARMQGAPAPIESVKPIIIERNVWIGRGAIIFPGVTIGENSVISAGAVVTSSVPPNSIALGNPARRLASV